MPSNAGQRRIHWNDNLLTKGKTKDEACQMDLSAAGVFQGLCVGVLCGLAEWEGRQVNTWCQSEISSPGFSICLVVVLRFKNTCLSV